MSDKTDYRQYCEENDVPIYYQEWWLNAVCGEDGWEAFCVYQNKKIVAIIPCAKKLFLKKKICYQPILTQTSGVLINYPDKQKSYQKLGFEKKIQQTVANYIDSNFYYFDQNFHPEFKNWLPFYWQNYNQTTRYTYVLSNIHNHEEIYNNFSPNLKKNLRKAAKHVIVKKDCDINTVYMFIKKTYNKQGLTIPFSKQKLIAIDQACQKHNCRMSFYAQDSVGNIHAIIYIVWDAQKAYYLAGGLDTVFSSSQSFSLLLWEAIKFSSKFVDKFDFEGSMIESIERIFRQFSAEQVPYFNINKGSHIVRTIKQFLFNHKAFGSRVSRFLRL